jgi:hypothetical protein
LTFQCCHKKIAEIVIVFSTVTENNFKDSRFKGKAIWSIIFPSRVYEPMQCNGAG